MTTDNLKRYCASLLPLSTHDLSMVDEYFFPLTLKKKAYLLEEGQVCDFIAFIDAGCIRHFHIKDGDEITCDISFENSFITDFASFNKLTPSNISFKALEDSQVFLVKRAALMELYERNNKFEKIGRAIAEQVVTRTTEIAMSLASDKPEVRYKKLLNEKPEIFQRVQQKYIANLLGLTPESLSRIRTRVYKSQNP